MGTVLKILVVFILVWTAYDDFKTKTIHNEMPALLLAAGFLCIWFMPEVLIWQRVAGIFCVSVPLLIAACIVPGSIGGGDIKLMAAGGFLLGIFNIWKAFETAVMVCAVFVLSGMIIGRLKRNSEIALGPFLCLGMLVEWLRI